MAPIQTSVAAREAAVAYIQAVLVSVSLRMSGPAQSDAEQCNSVHKQAKLERCSDSADTETDVGNDTTSESGTHTEDLSTDVAESEVSESLDENIDIQTWEMLAGRIAFVLKDELSHDEDEFTPVRVDVDSWHALGNRVLSKLIEQSDEVFDNDDEFHARQEPINVHAWQSVALRVSTVLSEEALDPASEFMNYE